MRAPHWKTGPAVPLVPRIRLTMLGGFDISDWQGRSLGLRCKKAAAMLAYLAACGVIAHAGTSSPGCSGKMRICIPPTTACVRWIFLVTHVPRSRGAAADLPPRHDRDQRGVRGGRHMEVQDEYRGRPTASARARGRVLSGPSFDGFGIDSLAFTEWLTIERRLRQAALDGCASLLSQHRAKETTGCALRVAQRKLTIDPLDEMTHRTLIGLYAAEGRSAMAVRQYQACRNILARELGIEPDGETKRLIEEIARRRLDRSKGRQWWCPPPTGRRCTGC